MITLYHGSSELFKKFDLSNAGEGTGIKFGFGVNLSESEASAVHYSQPRKQPLAKNHYLYTVEIPDMTEDNHIFSPRPVHPAIVKRTEAKLGKPAPAEKTLLGKEFRKWVGMTLTGGDKNGFAEEKAAAEFFDSIGVIYNVWPQYQKNPEGLLNFAVFNADRVRILNVEHIEIVKKGKRYVLVSRKPVA